MGEELQALEDAFCKTPAGKGRLPLNNGFKRAAAGVTDAKIEAHGAVLDRMDGVEKRIMELTPGTPAGLARHALVVREVCGHWWEEPEIDLDWDICVAKRLVDRVLALGGVS